MPSGRPLQYQTPDEMQVIIDQYFDDCAYNRKAAVDPSQQDDREVITEDLHPTITGLALVLDLTRKSLISYEIKELFVNTVKRAKDRVQAYAEQRLFYANATGTIFSMKNNFDWKDKTEQEISGHMDFNNISDEQLNAIIASKLAKINP